MFITKWFDVRLEVYTHTPVIAPFIMHHLIGKHSFTRRVIERPHAVLPATRVFISFAKWNSRACIFLLVYSHTPKRWAAPAARVFPQSYALRSLDRRHAQRPGRPSDALSMMKMTPRSGRAAAAAAAAATPIRINTHSLRRHARRWKLPSVGRGCKPLQLFV